MQVRRTAAEMDVGYGLERNLHKALSFYNKGCHRGSSVACVNYDELDAQLRADEAALSFRKTLKTGDVSHCGLVIEVTPPIAKVQSMIGEVWIKIEQLFPRDKQECRFRNGVYVDPLE